MTGWLLVEAGLVAVMVTVWRAGNSRARARARRRSVFYGNTHGHDHEEHR